MFDLRVSPEARRTVLCGRALVTIGFLFIALGVVIPLTGCGGGGKDAVLAKVGDHEITADYYEEKLGKLKQAELPRDADGLPMDTSTLAGKNAFLDIIINKELMYLKALELGYSKEDQITGAQKAMLEYQAGTALHTDLFDVPANLISDEELANYYARLPETRECSFLICNFQEDAAKARQAILDGGLWEDVAEEYHDGDMSPQGDYQMQVRWGYWEDSFENAVFNLEPGEISQPLETVYGYWILRLEEARETEAPPLESIKDRVLNSIRTRKINLKRKEFMAEMQAKYDFMLDESALWVVYEGLPEGEVIIDPVTNKPVPREELNPLDISLQDMDKLLLQYRQGDEMVTMTVGDYKVRFDQMNTFQRPKRSEMLGGLRQKLTQEAGKVLILEEARERGYFEDPRVVGNVTERVEEMIVSKLHSDVVEYDTYVSPDDLEAFFAEHGQEYVKPEGRDGFMVVCATQEDAEAASKAARGGARWVDVLAQYSSDENNKQSGGKLEMITANATGSLRDALFDLEKTGDVSEPVAHQDKWVVLQLGTIDPSRQVEIDEVRDQLGQRIKLMRQDEELRKLLTQWREEFGVTINENNLERLRSWEELSTAMPATGGVS